MLPIALWGRREITAAVAVIGLVAILVAAMIWYPETLNPGNDFGPEWSCSQAGQGDPVCIKRPPPQDKAP